jgi:hypothetical protein
MDEKKEVGSKMVESKEELNAGKMEFRNAIEAMSMEVSSKVVDKLVAAEEEEGEVVLVNAKLMKLTIIAKLIVAKLARYKTNFLAL